MGSEAAPTWVTERLRSSPLRRERERFYRDLKTFARKLGIQPSVVYFTELGCYSRIPTSIWNALLNHDVPMWDLDREYHVWQRECRETFGKDFILPNLELLSNCPWSNSYSPFYQIREALGFSRSEFCKGICVQPATLYRVESDKVKEFPIELKQALLQAGIPLDIVRDWDERTRLYAAA